MSFILAILILTQIPGPYQRKLLREGKVRFFKSFSTLTY